MFVLKLYNDGFVTLQMMNQKAILGLLTPAPTAVAAGFVKGSTCLLKNELTEEELLGSRVLQELLTYGQEIKSSCAQF